MSISTAAHVELNRHPPTRWSLGGQLLEALAARDFDLLPDCFEPIEFGSFFVSYSKA